MYEIHTKTAQKLECAVVRVISAFYAQFFLVEFFL